MVEKLAPVPDAGDPPVAVQAKVYGDVPPVADAVHATAVPTVPVAGHETVAARASAAMVIVCDALPVCGGVDVSDTDSDTVNVPLVA